MSHGREIGFPVSTANFWNSLPSHVMTCNLITVLCVASRGKNLKKLHFGLLSSFRFFKKPRSFRHHFPARWRYEPTNVDQKTDNRPDDRAVCKTVGLQAGRESWVWNHRKMRWGSYHWHGMIGSSLPPCVLQCHIYRTFMAPLLLCTTAKNGPGPSIVT